MAKKIQTWVEGQPSPYQLADLTHFPEWGNLVVWDAYFNNLTAGLMFIATIIWLAGPPIFGLALNVVLPVALVLLLIDLVFLISDLGDPVRFSHSLRILHLTSPLSVGVWGLSCYGIFLGLGIIFNWINIFTFGNPGLWPYFVYVMAKVFTILSCIGAIVVLCYKGIVFSCSSQPGLKNARWLPSFMIADALLMGTGLYVLLILVIAGVNAALHLVIPLVFLVFARSIAFWLLWENVKRRAHMVYSTENTTMFWVVLFLGGLCPVVLAFCGILGLVIAALAVLGCGIPERYWFIGLARPTPHYPEVEEN